MHLSVITATCRPARLLHCLEQFRSQFLGGLQCEQIVVSDGIDPAARFLADRSGARYFELEQPRGHAGAFAKDFGLKQARGEFVCFWDDDNLYAPHALTTLFAAACNVDLGVVRTQHRLRKGVGLITIPRNWSGVFRFGDIDTMCVCVRTDLAQRERWGDASAAPGTDYRWLHKLEAYQPRIRYVPIVIGAHL